MDANQKPPCEREWTIEEQEAFFASQDDVTGIFSGAVASNGIPNAPYESGADVSYEALCAFWMRERMPMRGPRSGIGIHITSIVPPEQGWPIIAHCDLCKKTLIVLSPYAVKPSDGDYFKMNGTCLDEELHWKHNMSPQKWYPWKETK